MTEKKRGKPVRTDWEAAERDYRTGKFSNVELAAKHKIDPATLSRKIKADRALDSARWQKDLTEVVRQATNARLMADLVKEKVKEGQEQVNVAVQAAALQNTEVILRQRGDIKNARDLAIDMLQELRLGTHSPEELQGLLRAATEGMDPEDLPAVQQSFKDLLKLHSRVTSVQRLADTLSKLQSLERKAFSLDDDDGDGGTPLVRVKDYTGR